MDSCSPLSNRLEVFSFLLVVTQSNEWLFCHETGCPGPGALSLVYIPFSIRFSSKELRNSVQSYCPDPQADMPRPTIGLR